ncbi:MAG: PAS domain S-box protein [Pirellulaceae bacterium]
MNSNDILALEDSVAADLSAGLEQWDLEESPARRQAALVILGRFAVQARDLDKLQIDGAALIARTLGLELYGVAQDVGDGRPVEFRFGPVGAAADGAAPQRHLIAPDKSRAAVSYAMQTGRPVVFADLSAENRFQDELLYKHGVKAGMICPLTHVDKIYGALCALSDSPRNFAKEDLLFVQSAAQLLGSSLARERAESALVEQTKFFSATLDTMEGLMIVLSPDGRIAHFNRACRQVTGFTPDEVSNRHIWSAFLLPQEVVAFKQILSRLRSSSNVEKIEAFLLTKHGERRRISWSFTAVRSPDGGVESLVGSGIDVTRQCEAMENLERAEADAEHARRALKDLRAQLDEADLQRLGKHLMPIDRHDVLPPDVKSDRRGQRRRAYPYVQIIAPIRGGRLPELHEFYDVRCRDISARGFSCLMDDPPLHRQFVVALGAHPTQIFLVAEVMHDGPYDFDGRRMSLVGCRYVARAEYDRFGPRDEHAAPLEL